MRRGDGGRHVRLVDLHQLIAAVDAGGGEGRVVHHDRVPPPERLAEQRDAAGHAAAAAILRTGPAVAGNLTLAMISSIQSWSWAGSGVIVCSTKYSTPASTRCLERGDDLVGRAEQVDRLEVLRPALGAHHLQERAVLLLARLRGVVRQHEVHEVLVRHDALARVAAVLAVVVLELAPVAGDLLGGQVGRGIQPSVRSTRALTDSDELGQVGRLGIGQLRAAADPDLRPLRRSAAR